MHIDNQLSFIGGRAAEKFSGRGEKSPRTICIHFNPLPETPTRNPETLTHQGIHEYALCAKILNFILTHFTCDSYQRRLTAR